MGGVLRVEGERAGEALGRGPEQVARGRDGVLGESIHQLRDAVVELVLQGMQGTQRMSGLNLRLDWAANKTQHLQHRAMCPRHCKGSKGAVPTSTDAEQLKG